MDMGHNDDNIRKKGDGIQKTGVVTYMKEKQIYHGGSEKKGAGNL